MQSRFCCSLHDEVVQGSITQKNWSMHVYPYNDGEYRIACGVEDRSYTIMTTHYAFGANTVNLCTMISGVSSAHNLWGQGDQGRTLWRVAVTSMTFDPNNKQNAHTGWPSIR